MIILIITVIMAVYDYSKICEIRIYRNVAGLTLKKIPNTSGLSLINLLREFSVKNLCTCHKNKCTAVYAESSGELYQYGCKVCIWGSDGNGKSICHKLEEGKQLRLCNGCNLNDLILKFTDMNVKSEKVVLMFREYGVKIKYTFITQNGTLLSFYLPQTKDYMSKWEFCEWIEWGIPIPPLILSSVSFSNPVTSVNMILQYLKNVSKINASFDNCVKKGDVEVNLTTHANITPISI